MRGGRSASAALVFDYLVGRLETRSRSSRSSGSIALFLGTFAAAVVQYGDHIYLSDDG